MSTDHTGPLQLQHPAAAAGWVGTEARGAVKCNLQEIQRQIQAYPAGSMYDPSSPHSSGMNELVSQAEQQLQQQQQAQ